MAPDPPLSEVERAVLDALMEPGRRVSPRTSEAIAALVGPDARAALRSLEGRDPALVREDVDLGVGIRFWMTTYEAAEVDED